MTSSVRFAGTAAVLALLTTVVAATATPALAQSVDVQVRVGDGYGDYPGPPGHAYRYGSGYEHGHGHRGPPRYGWSYRPAYYAAPPIYASPRCFVKVIRYYDDYEDAYVTKRVRRCW